MSQLKLFYRNAIKPISTMAAIAMVGLVALISAFFIASDSVSNSYATDTNSEVTTEIDSTHYVTLSVPDVTLSLSPSDSLEPSIQSVNVEIETNATGGADLYLAMSGNTNALYLNGDTTSTAPAIEATSSPMAANDLAANTWGYSTDDQTYSAVPTANSDPALLASVDGESVGSSAGGVITASVPVYFAASVDTSIPAGSYANRMTYSAVTDGGIITEATLTKIEIDGEEVENMQPEVENTLLITTNLMTNTYGAPRVYYETTNPAGYQECGDVVVSRNESGYMTITCKVTPSQAATGVTLHIVPKGSSDDIFCTNGDYQADTSNCEAGEWKWGSFVVEAPDIVEIKPLLELTYMQEMTPASCAKSNEGDTKQLIDERDGKYYWVAKLADDNCWMTQNLELDLSRHALTPADSDVSSDWDSGVQPFGVFNQGSIISDAIQFWIPSGGQEEFVLVNPSSTNECSPTTTLMENSCSLAWTNVYFYNSMTEYRTDGVVVDNNTNTYDAHYLTGYYYSWGAATAGSGNSNSSGNATDSICPAGWQLPNDGDNTTNGSFGYLLSQYGLTSAPTSSNYNIATAPLFFVRSGYVYPGSRLYNAGSVGLYWSKRSYSPVYAYGLRFTSSIVSTSDYTYHSRERGGSVRCVANWE